jgi:hypothetical protein
LKEKETAVAVALAEQLKQHQSQLAAVKATIPPPPPTSTSKRTFEEINTHSRTAYYGVSYRVGFPKNFFTVKILTAKENVVKGMLIDGEFISYEFLFNRVNTFINTRDSRVAAYHESGFIYKIERRNNDIKKLATYITKQYPNLIAPTFPSRHSASLIDAKDTLVEYRKRVFALWLEFIYNHPIVQRNLEMISFVVGAEAFSSLSNNNNNIEWPDSFENDMILSQETFQQAIQFSNYFRSYKNEIILQQKMNLRIIRDFHLMRRYKKI